MAEYTFSKIKRGSNLYILKDERVDSLIETVSLLDGLKYAKFTFPRHSNVQHAEGWYTVCKVGNQTTMGQSFALFIRGEWASTTPISGIFLGAIRWGNASLKELICPATGDGFTKIRIAKPTNASNGLYYLEVYSPRIITTGAFADQYLSLIGDFDLYETEGSSRIMSLTPNTEEMTVFAELNITAL